MDCSIISHDLCNKVERIYDEFGKYLYRYACLNAQLLINKFQNALQVCLKDFSDFNNRKNVFRYLLIHLQLLKTLLNMQVI
jgi:hypothetical protein